MTTTQIRTIDYRVPVEYYGDFAADYDTAAIDAAVLAQLNAKVPAGVTIAADGSVYAEVEVADEAREIDWRELLDQIDVDAIAVAHELSDSDYEELRQEAGVHGDTATVRDCDAALAGDAESRARCAQIIFQARAEMSE